MLDQGKDASIKKRIALYLDAPLGEKLQWTLYAANQLKLSPENYDDDMPGSSYEDFSDDSSIGREARNMGIDRENYERYIVSTLCEGCQDPARC
jgi:hypothetical protein